MPLYYTFSISPEHVFLLNFLEINEEKIGSGDKLGKLSKEKKKENRYFPP